MTFIVAQIKEEWHDPHVEHESGMGRVPVIRAKGELITDPDEVAKVRRERPHHVICRMASPDEAEAIQAMLDERRAKELVWREVDRRAADASHEEPAPGVHDLNQA